VLLSSVDKHHILARLANKIVVATAGVEHTTIVNVHYVDMGSHLHAAPLEALPFTRASPTMSRAGPACRHGNRGQALTQSQIERQLETIADEPLLAQLLAAAIRAESVADFKAALGQERRPNVS
jgi:hypothetical protein